MNKNIIQCTINLRIILIFMVNMQHLIIHLKLPLVQCIICRCAFKLIFTPKLILKRKIVYKHIHFFCLLKSYRRPPLHIDLRIFKNLLPWTTSIVGVEENNFIILYQRATINHCWKKWFCEEFENNHVIYSKPQIQVQKNYKCNFSMLCNILK